MVLHNPHRATRFPLCLAASITLLLFSFWVKAQETEPVDVISVRTDLVAVLVTVTDSRGRRISDLTQQDFSLMDDGRDSKIDYFASGTERIALAFVLDNSGSLREQLSRQREAALGLFSRFGPNSSVAVIRFGEQAKLLAPFTRETDRAVSAFSIPVNQSALGNRTAIFDAALTAIQAYAGRNENSPERRIAILISDGLDTASRANAQQVIAAASRMNVSFYVIQLPLFTPRDGRLVPRPAAKGFRDLAERTGGRYFVAGTSAAALAPNSPVDLTAVFTAIEDDLRSQYVIGFYPGEASRDGNPHRTAILVSNRKLKVHQLRSSYSLKPGP
ncbi:MAG: Ca-activated chloride channel [Solirubrobacteraceae bacterium]|nr:Ca-activated chloride channel [Solirubrobacteraceae bacterium]